jgi:hypothetical protein
MPGDLNSLTRSHGSIGEIAMSLAEFAKSPPLFHRTWIGPLQNPILSWWCQKTCHVLSAKSKRVIHCVALRHTPLRPCFCAHIVFKSFHELFHGIHPTTLNWATQEYLFHQMHEKMCHDIKESKGEFFLQHTQYYDCVIMEFLLLVRVNHFLATLFTFIIA